MRGVVRGVLQRLDKQGLPRLRVVAGKLTHLIGLSAVGELVGDGQHLICLQARLQRDITQGVVHRIFRRGQQSRTGQLLIVHTALETGNPCQHGTGLIDVTSLGELGHEGLVFGIGGIAGHRHSCQRPDRIAHPRVLAQVGQGDDVSGVTRGSRLVGDPDLHAVHLDTRSQVGQGRHRLVIVVAEVSGEEEVAVLLVVGCADLESCGL